LGDENAVGFTLNFDPSALRPTGASVGGGAPGAMVNFNTNQAAAGRLGIALALPVGKTFVAGERLMVEVGFANVASRAGSWQVSFSDTLVVRTVSDAQANELATDYFGGTVTVHPWPTLAISKSNDVLTLSWPKWAGGFAVESTELLPGGWTRLPVSGQTNGSVISLPIPTTDSARFYRLALP
jgi:hypothetical protein